MHNKLYIARHNKLYIVRHNKLKIAEHDKLRIALTSKTENLIQWQPQLKNLLSLLKS